MEFADGFGGELRAIEVRGGYVETDGNLINRAFLTFRLPENIGRFASFEAAQEAIRLEWNRQAENWNYYANFGPP